jgi:hypothetical protein
MAQDREERLADIWKISPINAPSTLPLSVPFSSLYIVIFPAINMMLYLILNGVGSDKKA